jgi:hypothetical protein
MMRRRSRRILLMTLVMVMIVMSHVGSNDNNVSEKLYTSGS